MDGRLPRNSSDESKDLNIPLININLCMDKNVSVISNGTLSSKSAEPTVSNATPIKVCLNDYIKDKTDWE